MKSGRQRPNFEFSLLFFCGILLFLCGFILFAVEHNNASFYSYSLSMCVLGIVSVMSAMLDDVEQTKKLFSGNCSTVGNNKNNK